MSALVVNPRRFALIVRNDLSGARTAAIMLAAASGTIFVLYVLTSVGGGAAAFHEITYPILLLLLGFIVSSFAFSEIHDSRAGVFVFVSPGSLLEKYLSRIILTSLGWIVAATAVYIAATAAGAAVAGWLFHRSHGIFLPSRRWIWQTMASYLATQSVFAFGSIYFRKAAFIKTILSGTLIAIGLGIFTVIAWRAVYWNAFTRLVPTEAEMSAVMNVASPAVDGLMQTAQRAADIFRWALLPAFMWVLGYLRLRETEV